jgi:SAM-dependent methyltransferase
MSLQAIRTRWRRFRSRLSWEGRWSRRDFHPFWLTESPPPFLLSGFDEGWLSPGMDVLEIGSGAGYTAAWLASRGLRVVGIDFSRQAIRRARRSFPDRPGLTLKVVDVCASTPLGTHFDVIIDSGCLHNIAEPLRSLYRRSVLLWSRPGTRLVVKMHTVETPADVRREQVQSLLVPPFKLVKCEDSPSPHPQAMGRLNPVFHLVRLTSATAPASPAPLRTSAWSSGP